MIKEIQFKPFDLKTYPFDIPQLKSVKSLDLSQPITIFVGDNGSGKSTLLKAIAFLNNSINVSSQTLTSTDFKGIHDLSKYLSLSYDYQSKKGFFFSGESFITYINHLKTMKQELIDDLKRIDIEYKDKPEATKALARMASAGQLYEMNQRYEGELNQKSHGEGFLAFFKDRMHQKGIYILDEPETPLSQINQYQLFVMLTDLARSGSQLIIATHSPILMALENALIYSFDEEQIKPINYEDIESVQFLKDFLNHTQNYKERL